MKLNYKIFGEGTPLLIMHGLLGMLDNWQGPAKMFAEHFKVYIIDLRNHGHSPHSEQHDYDSMVEDVLELMDELSINQAHILGHSMGGKVAMKLAQHCPKRVLKLVVADIGPKFYPIHHQRILAALRAVDLEALERRTDAEDYMKPHIQEAGIRYFLMKSLYHPEKNKFAWRFNLDAIESNIEKVGEAMDTMDYEGETLFIRGGASDYILDEDWPDIKLIFPNAHLVTLDGAGHWLHAEQPDAFVKEVSEFLLG